MNSEQLMKLSSMSDNLAEYADLAWNESLTGGDKKKSEYYFALFELQLKRLNETVERFHMDNENEVTSERVQP